MDEPDHPEQQAAARQAVLGGALLELHRVHLLLQRQTLEVGSQSGDGNGTITGRKNSHDGKKAQLL